MYLGTLYIYTKFRPDQIPYGCEASATILEKQLSRITLELMPGSSPNWGKSFLFL
jgi:hypothetical protein